MTASVSLCRSVGIIPARTSKRTTRTSSSSNTTVSTAAGDSTCVTTQSAQVAVPCMQQVSQEMISDVVFVVMTFPRSLALSGSTHGDHRKGVCASCR